MHFRGDASRAKGQTASWERRHALRQVFYGWQKKKLAGRDAGAPRMRLGNHLQPRISFRIIFTSKLWLTSRINTLKTMPANITSIINASTVTFAAKPLPTISNGTTTAATLSFTNNPKAPRKRLAAKKQRKVVRLRRSGITEGSAVVSQCSVFPNSSERSSQEVQCLLSRYLFECLAVVRIILFFDARFSASS